MLSFFPVFVEKNSNCTLLCYFESMSYLELELYWMMETKFLSINPYSNWSLIVFPVSIFIFFTILWTLDV